MARCGKGGGCLAKSKASFSNCLLGTSEEPIPTDTTESLELDLKGSLRALGGRLAAGGLCLSNSVSIDLCDRRSSFWSASKSTPSLSYIALTSCLIGAGLRSACASAEWWRNLVGSGSTSGSSRLREAVLCALRLEVLAVAWSDWLWVSYSYMLCLLPLVFLFDLRMRLSIGA